MSRNLYKKIPDHRFCNFLKRFKKEFELESSVIYTALGWSRQKYYHHMRANTPTPFDGRLLKELASGCGIEFVRVKEFVDRFLYE